LRLTLKKQKKERPDLTKLIEFTSLHETNCCILWSKMEVYLTNFKKEKLISLRLISLTNKVMSMIQDPKREFLHGVIEFCMRRPIVRWPNWLMRENILKWVTTGLCLLSLMFVCIHTQQVCIKTLIIIVIKISRTKKLFI